MRELLARDPRFVETKYYLGSYDVSLLITGQDKLDEADHLFDEAYAWRPEWPALTQSIANVAMTVEEFERAALFYERTLALEPHAVDALLGKARALTYLGRSVEAIATLDTLLAERWFVGDARYWRALNESELERNDEAWTDIELAAKLLVNAEVPKLAGLIAYRRHELDVSRGEVRRVAHAQPARLRDRLLPGRRARRAARLAAHRRRCCSRRPTASQGAELAYTKEIDEDPRVERSAGAPGQEDRAGASSTSPKDAAIWRRRGSTSPSRTTTCRSRRKRGSTPRRWSSDEQFGERAKEILSRLAKSP